MDVKKVLVFIILIQVIFSLKAYSQNLSLPIIDSVTVQTFSTQTGLKQLAVITWASTVEPNRDSYFIYKSVPPALITLDSVSANQNSFIYTDAKLATGIFVESLAETEKEVFSVVASHIDNRRNSGFSATHSTIFLSENFFDACSQQISLSWNAYEGWTEGIRVYRIFVSQSGGAFTQVDSIVGGATLYNYVFKNLKSDTDNKFFVRAVSNIPGKTSSSNIKTFFPSFGTFPDHVYLYEASINNNNDTIKISWIAGQSTAPIIYILQRSNSNLNFNNLDTIIQQGNTAFLYFQFQKDVSEVYYYRVVAQTTCPVGTFNSQILNTVLLQTKTFKDFSNEITWNRVEGWENDAKIYDLYRNDFLIGSFDQSVNLFLDGDTGVILKSTSNCYKIIAREKTSQYGTNGINQSNTICVFPENNIFCPDAFTPGGANPIFKPVLVGIEQKEYSLKIYDRWGGLVFATNDQDVGWDGKLPTGNVSYTSVFVYLISGKKQDGRVIEKRGTIMVIFP